MENSYGGFQEEFRAQEEPGVQEESTTTDLNAGRPATVEDLLQTKESLRQTKESVHQAQVDAELARIESQRMLDEIEELKRELSGPRYGTWMTAVLLIALAAAGAFAYFQMRGPGSELAQFPTVQKSVSSLDQELSGARGQLQALAANWGELTARVDKVEAGLRANLTAAKDFSTAQSDKVQQQLQSEMDNQERAVDAKLSNLESAQQTDHSQIAALEQEVTTTREEAHQQLASVQATNGREFDSVRSQIAQTQNGMNAMARNMDRQRFDFEVNIKESGELAPGLSFTVLKADVAHQQVNGYLRLNPDGRVLWVHDQGIEQPMLFHSQDDPRPYEVVFTRIAANGAIGYVLMPRWPDAPVQAASGPAAKASAPERTSASLR